MRYPYRWIGRDLNNIGKLLRTQTNSRIVRYLHFSDQFSHLLTRLLKANFPCRCITLEQASEFRLHVSFSGILYSLFLVQPSPTSPPHCVENFPRSSSPWSVLFRIFVDATETLHLLEHLCELRVPRPSALTHEDRYKDTSTVSTSGPRATGRSQRLFENEMASSLARSPPPDPSQRTKNGLEGAL